MRFRVGCMGTDPKACDMPNVQARHGLGCRVQGRFSFHSALWAKGSIESKNPKPIFEHVHYIHGHIIYMCMSGCVTLVMILPIQPHTPCKGALYILYKPFSGTLVKLYNA